ncbi:MAG: hypothetical protein Q8O56_04025 [Solirubrobacteraceae bacterium]|nr:hypothetical protein [Solirubrobacteraceae bacterium]
MRLRRAVPAGLLVALILPATAPATALERAPVGYTWCGYRDFMTNEWSRNVTPDGAFMVAYARGMTCAAAIRNARRVTFARGGPRRAGYRCLTMRSAHEFLDYRCTARSGKRRAFRVRTGA